MRQVVRIVLVVAAGLAYAVAWLAFAAYATGPVGPA